MGVGRGGRGERVGRRGFEWGWGGCGGWDGVGRGVGSGVEVGATEGLCWGVVGRTGGEGRGRGNSCSDVANTVNPRAVFVAPTVGVR